ncbi:cobalt-zinc-cadmium resistance protein CzcA [Mucilaginibacter gracilis]|uniref:Cobalt-zinc-cadmium resistance protein CzcA n=1 Tax=Mucilaginibacter gracilis TaxID=423350 RepID=A0A495J3V3_9SPHI|nr:CusA/CzcA family heavy metal efflux RND transporter [Mucilaginibacter gracilis]RKR83665.1 cobalt-zinc-cadmium resistance protein CzcA [Mucilaginibacter gracilis]
MLDAIIRFSIRNKLVIGFFTLALMAWGIWSTSQIPVDALPDITNNQVQVITKAPTLAAQEVEQFITYPVERSLSNLPDVTEMRSMSRFGLSVITIVFKESVNVYFARQLIAEKLNEVQEQIPKGTGRPEMAPVTTGLGEIYQYILHPKKGSKHQYSAMELRTMQDWIVTRQLYGIAGVAEVTAFGGLAKQYEVALDPDKLKAMDVTIPEIFTALEKNNQNTGGAYIDRKPNAYFIRGVGLMTGIPDIENTIIKRQTNGVPILVKNVAKIQLGSPPRYGAMTYNGEKEVVGGIVLMTKGANSAEVVGLVKERMELVQKSLPNDVVIEPFLDRTNLINRAISTVERNLIEGALIVIFVLVLFLGNWRAGLIVASAIPLALLFALSMMNLFGVSANLMSLGAIDFGLIVDGAVIIVEATMHHLILRKSYGRFTQAEMDEEVFQSASRIRNSAAFGEIIILVVYIPILTLTGIEGKMFRPMAQTVGFAILGALLLSLTYIPMMSALLLSKNAEPQKTLSNRMMGFLQRKYQPVLKAAIRFKYQVVGAAVVLLIVSGVIFSKMGGEFIPQLEEGDYAIEFVLPQGTSLTQTVETIMQAERMLKKYPEVKMLVGKTGSADVATDPMPPEASDLMVILKDKSEWPSGKGFYQLADDMRNTLADLPGVIAEPSQPIQMRFNELMTGVKQDVAVKIFGENLDTLNMLAVKVAQAIKPVQGVTAPQVERVSGLPQITVKYDRARMANYGLNIEDVNQVISTAFAGNSTGSIYENERRFDLVVRLDSAHRNAIENVSDLFIPTPDGNQIPLSQVASVTYQTGPAQISRENARRRIVVSFNVTGRDVESAVKEVQAKLNAKIPLPSGYYYTYGGTFQNLRQASARLMIAVPAALLLIFILLYFTFKSFKQAMLIFSAIPMSAIGGVFALLLRGMPFSISAGVGFIALFGVAVLNGIVLIGTFNQLAKDGVDDVLQRIYEGTKDRLRPVLMTGAVASLGFLPMAVSSSAGAEVQKPLATVVIGGLLTATLLTLVVLPLLYLIFTKNQSSSPNLSGKMKKALIALLVMGFTLPTFAQSPTAKRISLNSAYEMAMQNNLQLRSLSLKIDQRKELGKTAFNLPKTGVFVENEDINPDDQKGILKIGVSQSLDWPGLYSARKKLLNEQTRSAEFARQVQIADIKRDIAATYYNLWYYQSKQRLWQKLDSIYSALAKAAVLRVKTGENAGLDSIAAKAKAQETKVQLRLIQRDMANQQQALKRLVNTKLNLLPDSVQLQKINPDGSEPDSAAHPLLKLQQQQVNIAGAEAKVTGQGQMPSLEGRFFSQRLYGVSPPYSGFSVTVGIPLFGRGQYKHLVKAAQLEQNYQQTLLKDQQLAFNTSYSQERETLQKNDDLLNYYTSSGLKQADAIINAANLSYRYGEIGFGELSQFLTQAIDIQRNYLDVLNEYNQSAIQLNYYTNNSK